MDNVNHKTGYDPKNLIRLVRRSFKRPADGTGQTVPPANTRPSAVTVSPDYFANDYMLLMAFAGHLGYKIVIF